MNAVWAATMAVAPAIVVTITVATAIVVANTVLAIASTVVINMIGIPIMFIGLTVVFWQRPTLTSRILEGAAKAATAAAKRTK